MIACVLGRFGVIQEDVSMSTAVSYDDIIISLKYICPDCSFPAWLTQKQSQIGQHVCSYCDETFKIQPVSLACNKNEIHKRRVSLDLGKVTGILGGFGLNKGESASIIKMAVKKGGIDDTEKLIKQCLSLL